MEGNMSPEDILNKSNEELIEWFRSAILEAEPDPEWKRRLEEYHNNIDRDFKEEWSRKHLKWLFTKRRQAKLRYKITRRYTPPVFWIIEDIIDETLPKTFNENFQRFVDVKNITLADTNCKLQRGLRAKTGIFLDDVCDLELDNILEEFDCKEANNETI
jgi:hypothetical protein